MPLVFFNSPLEQFVNVFGLCLSPSVYWLGLFDHISSTTIQLILVFGFILCLYGFESKNIFNISFLVNFRYSFIKLFKSLMQAYQINPILTVFLFFIANVLFFSNVVGMLPYSTTIFAQFILVLFISIVIFSIIILQIVTKRKLRSFNVFIPSSVPLFIIPLSMWIEVISFFSRVVSLTVRLFANLTAGHILLKIFSTFLLTLVSSINVGILVVPLLFSVIVVITCLELTIAVLQTYVYLTLTLIYLNEVNSSQH